MAARTTARSAASARRDAARTMALLWGEERRPTRGPKPTLSVDQLVGTAIALADAEGLGQLSMRRVAEELGVGTMSLYTYVRRKDELLVLMLDRVLGEIAPPGEDVTGWRARLEHHARQQWDLYQRHPWVLQAAGPRALLGPNETAAYELALRALDGVGLTGRQVVAVVALLGGYVRGAAQEAAAAALTEQRTGMSDEAWWEVMEPLLDRYYDPDRFPTLTRLSAEGAFAPLEEPADTSYYLANSLATFEFGLQRVLDGVAALIG